MDKYISPEEKLLNLIKSKGRQKPQQAVLPSAKLEAEKSAKEDRVKPQAQYLLKKINLVLAVLVICLFVAMLINFIFSAKRQNLMMQEFSKKVSEQINYDGNRKAQASQSEMQDRASLRQQPLPSKDVFMPSNILSEQGDAAGQVDNSKTGLNLIGISSGDNLQAIIEDKSKNKTYFLYEGQSGEDIRIEKITPDKVILDYKGIRMELSL